jgi:hypothetical protein
MVLLLSGGASASPPDATPPAVAPRLPPIRLGAHVGKPVVPPPAIPLPAPQPVRRAVKPKTPPPPKGPLPDVKLSIDAPTTDGTWTMRVTNAGDVPVRLVADARLLSLEVTPRGERKPVVCELPADMRPADDLERPLVLPAKRSYVESFEPRLHCFGAHALSALAPGAIVVARLGWTGKTHDTAPWEVSPIDGVEPEVAPLAALTAPPIGLPDEETATAAPTATDKPPELDAPRLDASGPISIDATSVEGLSITVTLHSSSARPVLVRFRPETLAFEVRGPNGVEHCGWPRQPATATRELFTTLPPKGNESLAVLLSAYCSAKVFERPGLLVVRPHLDTRKAGAEDLGLRAFEGQVIATTPTLVRLRQGTAPPRLVRPRLEDEK